MATTQGLIICTVSPEAVKKVFLEISQNSQENTCASPFFNKVAFLEKPQGESQFEPPPQPF